MGEGGIRWTRMPPGLGWRHLDSGFSAVEARAMKKPRARPAVADDAAPFPPRFHRGMLVADALEADPRAKDVLLELGLPCHQCVVADHETLAEGCTPLGLDVNRVVERLNALLPRPCSPSPSRPSPA